MASCSDSLLTAPAHEASAVAGVAPVALSLPLGATCSVIGVRACSVAGPRACSEATDDERMSAMGVTTVSSDDVCWDAMEAMMTSSGERGLRHGVPQWRAEVLVRVRAVASTGHTYMYLQRFAVAQLQVDRR